MNFYFALCPVTVLDDMSNDLVFCEFFYELPCSFVSRQIKLFYQLLTFVIIAIHNFIVRKVINC